jgi:steroid Delta-isomerase
MVTHADARVARVIDWFEALSPADLPGIGAIYADDASFKDPFNEVRGAPAIRAIFEHMFATLDGPRFVVHDALAQGDQCFLRWDFVFGTRSGATLTVRGATHLQFGADTRIVMHRDYWDAAEELYEKLPLLGALMRWLKRRVNA